jgi:hypothetical protein
VSDSFVSSYGSEKEIPIEENDWLSSKLKQEIEDLRALKDELIARKQDSH